MQRVALYARVSTRRQEQEATIESQLDRLLSDRGSMTMLFLLSFSSSTKRSVANTLPGQGWIGCGTLRPLAPYRPCCA